MKRAEYCPYCARLISVRENGHLYPHNGVQVWRNRNGQRRGVRCPGTDYKVA